MLGVIVNTLTVLVGSSIGLLAKKIIPRDWSGFIICGMGLCTMYIGISGSFEGQNTLVAVVSMAVGAVIGLSIGIDKRVKAGKTFYKEAGTRRRNVFYGRFCDGQHDILRWSYDHIGLASGGPYGRQHHALHESDDGWHRGGFLCGVFRFRCSGSQLFHIDISGSDSIAGSVCRTVFERRSHSRDDLRRIADSHRTGAESDRRG